MLAPQGVETGQHGVEIELLVRDSDNRLESLTPLGIELFSLRG